MPLLSNLKARFGKFFKKCREYINKIVKASATVALVNHMSCAGRNYREVLNACYDKKIIYNCYSWANHGMGHFPLITNNLEISMDHSL